MGLHDISLNCHPSLLWPVVLKLDWAPIHLTKTAKVRTHLLVFLKRGHKIYFYILFRAHSIFARDPPMGVRELLVNKIRLCLKKIFVLIRNTSCLQTHNPHARIPRFRTTICRYLWSSGLDRTGESVHITIMLHDEDVLTILTSF